MARGGQQGVRARVRAAGKVVEGMTDRRFVHCRKISLLAHFSRQSIATSLTSYL